MGQDRIHGRWNLLVSHDYRPTVAFAEMESPGQVLSPWRGPHPRHHAARLPREPGGTEPEKPQPNSWRGLNGRNPPREFDQSFLYATMGSIHGGGWAPSGTAIP